MEIMLKLSTGKKNSINQFLPLWVPLLGISEDLAGIVNRTLYWILLSFLLAFHNHHCADNSFIGSYI